MYVHRCMYSLYICIIFIYNLYIFIQSISHISLSPLRAQQKSFPLKKPNLSSTFEVASSSSSKGKWAELQGHVGGPIDGDQWLRIEV